MGDDRVRSRPQLGGREPEDVEEVLTWPWNARLTNLHKRCFRAAPRRKRRGGEARRGERAGASHPDPLPCHGRVGARLVARRVVGESQTGKVTGVAVRQILAARTVGGSR